MDFLVEMTTHVPSGTSAEVVDEIRAREAVRARELVADGHLLRLWRPPLAPGQWRTFGLFAAEDADQLEEQLASMPLRVWRTDVVTPLLAHPNDPRRGSASPQLTEFLTTLTIAGQSLGLTRVDIPFIVGTMFTPNRDRAKVIGVAVHIINGWLFAFVYALFFENMHAPTVTR